MNTRNTHYKKTVDDLETAYSASALLIYGPLRFTAMLILAGFENGGGSYNFSAFFAILGVVLLPGAIALTAVSAPLGLFGIVGTSLYAAVALPIAIARDKFKSTPPTATSAYPAATPTGSSTSLVNASIGERSSLTTQIASTPVRKGSPATNVIYPSLHTVPVDEPGITLDPAPRYARRSFSR